MNYDEFLAERKRRREIATLLMMAELRIARARVIEQQSADEEGCGAVLCAIRAARWEIVLGRA